VLVYSEDPAAVETAVTQLEEWGAQPSVQFDLGAAEAALESRRPQLILLDLGRYTEQHPGAMEFLQAVRSKLLDRSLVAPMVLLGDAQLAAHLDAASPWLHVAPHDNPALIATALRDAIAEADPAAAAAATAEALAGAEPAAEEEAAEQPGPTVPPVAALAAASPSRPRGPLGDVPVVPVLLGAAALALLLGLVVGVPAVRRQAQSLPAAQGGPPGQAASATASVAAPSPTPAAGQPTVAAGALPQQPASVTPIPPTLPPPATSSPPPPPTVTASPPPPPTATAPPTAVPTIVAPTQAPPTAPPPSPTSPAPPTAAPTVATPSSAPATVTLAPAASPTFPVNVMPVAGSR
jgi:hypothetical protein